MRLVIPTGAFRVVPVHLNRRRFLGCSAAAGIALTQGNVADASLGPETIRVGFVGLGNRGTALLRAVLEMPGVEVAAVADIEEKHAVRGCAIAEKATSKRPDRMDSAASLLERDDVHAVVIAVPCDLHAGMYHQAIQSRKHLFAEKPLALTLADCDSLIQASSRNPELAIHVGHQRRSNPRVRQGVELIRSGELGDLIEARTLWTSSNGPVQGHRGWLGQRARSGDWMVEQAVHVWDLLHWATDQLPDRAYGVGRKNVFAAIDADRDVTDWYHVELDWASGFHASMTHSWIDPSDDAFTGNSQKILGTKGGIDLGRGIVTFRDKSLGRRILHPENVLDTRDAITQFLAAARTKRPGTPPVSLLDARDAVATGLMVRKAVDENRLVLRSEIG